MASGLTLKEQPGLDAEFTRRRFHDQVTCFFYTFLYKEDEQTNIFRIFFIFLLFELGEIDEKIP